MEKAWISNVTSGCRSVVFSVILVTSVAGCVAQEPSEALSFVEPPMQWDAHPEAEGWTDSTLVALSTKDPILSEKIPADIETWCPGYADAPIEARRAFWAGLMSSVAKYESTWNPQASGGGGRWIGLMQISPRSAKYYGCKATSATALKDGESNLECAVEIMSEQVAKDGMVAGNGNLGIGRDWAPLRSDEKRADMAAWTSAQPYCQAG
ncbi:MAG: transglycosylase SLT domain-containing protein [Tabrizicola sp.]|nr:transglycosylase SLT domain-containing protein [Tabrizicola sp.]